MMMIKLPFQQKSMELIETQLSLLLLIVSLFLLGEHTREMYLIFEFL